MLDGSFKRGGKTSFAPRGFGTRSRKRRPWAVCFYDEYVLEAPPETPQAAPPSKEIFAWPNTEVARAPIPLTVAVLAATVLLVFFVRRSPFTAAGYASRGRRASPDLSAVRYAGDNALTDSDVTAAEEYLKQIKNDRK
ncbi:MAG: hypothetical protein IJT76_03600 [Clostridia bacterium]|nr:hypothetical protein [Clostridia bacterium]